MVLASINFIRTAYSILKSSSRLDDLEDEVSQMETKRDRLLAEIEEKKTPEFIEEKARNELNMIKPGERLIVFVNDSLHKNTAPTYAPNKEGPVLGVSDMANVKKSSNPELWLRLFFGD